MPKTVEPHKAFDTESAFSPLLELVAPELFRAAHLDLLILPLMAEVARRVGADVAISHLLDRTSRELFARVEHLPGLSEIRSPIGSGIVGSVAAQNAPLASHRVPDGSKHTHPTQGAWMAVPIKSQDPQANATVVVGVLEATRADRRSPFTDGELALLEALAAELSEALAMTQLDDSAASPTRYNMLIGHSSVMQELYAELQRASQSSQPTLLVGAAGTGKTLAAQAIHQNSQGRRSEWTHIRPAATPASLVRHHLFGLGQASTLYIEHITRLSQEIQEELAKSLLNGDLDKVRLLASTRLDLSEEVAQGRFHPALAKEFRGGAIVVPNLKDRGRDDFSRLVRFWLRDCARNVDRPARGIDPEALRYLHERQWNAGLRELRLWVERAVLTSDQIILSTDDVSQGHPGGDPELVEHLMPSGLPLAEVEERYILRTLAEHQQNRTRASRALGIGRNTLVRKLREYIK